MRVKITYIKKEKERRKIRLWCFYSNRKLKEREKEKKGGGKRMGG